MRVDVLVASIAILIATQYQIVKCAKLDLPGLTDMIRPMSKSCQKKGNVPQNLIEGTRTGQFPREKSLMCYFKCLSVMLKVMNKQGEVTLKAVNRQIDLLVVEELAPKLKDIGKLCFEKVPPVSDSCEYAYDLVICGYNEDKSLYFLP